MAPVRYRAADVDGFKIFYREAGPADAPKLLLLHGFPSAGHMFRDLMPLLTDRFHIVAPDGSVNPICRREINSNIHSTTLPA